MVSQTLYTCDRCKKQGTEVYLREFGYMESHFRHDFFKVKAALCHDCQKALDEFLKGKDASKNSKETTGANQP